MNNINMKKLLRLFRNNNIIELYEDIFDKVFDLKKIVLISDEDAFEIMCNSDIMCVVKLYEVINNVCISEKVKEYIQTINDREKIKYILRLAISNSFDNEELRLNYIDTICEVEDNESIKYAYAVANDKRVNSNENGLEYVRIVGNTKKDISIHIRDLLLQNGFLDDVDAFEFVKTLSYAKEEYIVEYMISLYNSKIFEEKIPVEYLSVLLSSKGITQAQYAYDILKNKEMMKRKDGLFIALAIATREETYQAERGYIALTDKNLLEREDASQLIFEIITSDTPDDKLDVECEIREILETKNIDEIIRSLLSIKDEEVITLNTKVKTKLK